MVIQLYVYGCSDSLERNVCFQKNKKNKNIHIRNIQVVCILSRGQTKPEQCCLVSDINAAGPMTATLLSQNITRKKITNKCIKGK